MIQATAAGQVKILQAPANDFWTSVGIFPDALKSGTNESERLKESRKRLRALARSDLLVICQHFNLLVTDRADVEELITTILAASDAETLYCLTSFLKRRSVFIAREFERQRKSRTLRVDLASLRSRRLKPFSQLLVLYHHSPDSLRNIFYSHLWEAKRTNTDFESDKALPKNFSNKLKDGLKDLETTISKAWGAQVRKFGQHTLPNGLTVLAFDREYSPAIRKDFRAGFNVHFRCGDVVFGISKDRDFIHVKNQNSKITNSISTFLENLFEIKLKPQQAMAFSGYEPATVQSLLLGGYDADSQLQIFGAGFRRTSLQTGSALSLRARSDHSSIRDDLVRLRDDKIIVLDSFDDLEWLDLSLDEKIVRVEVEQLRGGAVRFALDDANCSADFVDRVKGQFKDTFGLPLNRMIDPQKMALGAASIISFLLNVRLETEVQNYQRTEYDNLISRGILETEQKLGKACPTRICPRYKQNVADQEATACLVCDQPLRAMKFKTVARSMSHLRAFAGDFFRSAGWALGDMRSFEKREYFELKNAERHRDTPVWILFRDHLSDKDRQQYERSSEAIVLVTASSDRQHIFVDTHGICHVSLPYMIASQATPESADEAARLCREVLSRLQTSSNLRIEKAAQHSYAHLKAGTKGDKGHVYETEIFNILRSLFPYAHQLGREGKAEPDGIVSIPYYGEEGDRDLGKGRSWTWTYDAKHSDSSKGYDLGIDERRKMVEYIGRFRRKKMFMDEHARLRAHVIISNNLSIPKMKSTAEYVFSTDGLKQQHRDVRLILMEEEFLIALYEGFRKHKDEVQLRLPMVGECLIPFLDKDTADGYVHLRAIDAENVINEILSTREVDRVLPKDKVLKGLDSPG